ncbi:sensor histidine kinase [Roseomonas sp. AR75]|uniref:sensor histidine kinase n=1 Tax=Roseomonas sp. AR75 TaxID=2562311 RepID=UPI001484CE06|nr:sensor histidine kinase [Roseomonas sp. AR75]
MTLALVGVFTALDLLAMPSAPHFAVAPYLVAILLSAALFDSGTGLFATALCTVLAGWLHLGPGVEEGWIALLLFACVGVAMALVTEALHKALARSEAMEGALRRAERTRTLLLHEFRHRTRNDLGSLIGLLILRSRIAPSAAAREALRDAADHAMALARVHARLALDEGLDLGAERPMVDTRDFVSGLCADIDASSTAEGPVLVRLVTEAESHALSAERAVPLGLVLNESVANARRYAFPDDRGGIVQVRFRREGADFVLTIADDGIGLPQEDEVEAAPPDRVPGAGLGTRLLRALAAQLRGRFARHAGPAGKGTVVEFRFAAAEPGT